MSDTFLASLLSENLNETCPKVENYNIKNELPKKLVGLIAPKSEVNGVIKDEQSQDIINSPVKEETLNSDRNGNYKYSTDVNGKEEETKSLPLNGIVSTAKMGIDEECNNQTEMEVIKDVTIVTEFNKELPSLNTLSSFEVLDAKLESTAHSQKYRDDVDSSDDDTTSTYSLSSSSDCSDSFLDKMHRSVTPAVNVKTIKTKGELDLDELPPIEDLTIDVTETEMKKVGTIHAIVDKLVIVKSLKELRPLDLDSVLFLSFKNPLGRIFDVFGPVVEPFYSIRFNSPQHIADKCIVIDSDVFFAPEKEDITTYVFVDQLIKQKGSDASWQDNNEPPEEYIDYSDDEEERAAKHNRKAKNRPRQIDGDDVQVIPNKKVSHDSKWKDADKIHPWTDKQSSRSSSNPFRIPYPPSEGSSISSYARPSMAAVMTSKYTPKRYGSFDSLASTNLSRYGSLESLASSQGGTNSLQNYATQQNYASVPQSPSSSTMSTASFPSSYFSSPPPFLGPQSPLPPQSSLPFMFQQQTPPFIYHPGMSPNPIFGQVPYFSQGLQSPIGVPPPPASSVPFVFAAQPAANPSPNFMTPPPNFTNQASQFMNHPASVSQASNFVNQNSAMVQAVAAGAQWQQAPPTPYGISPLSISIPSTPPPNVIQTPIPSPYNLPQSQYFGNMQ